jgi:hypothetical protein
MIDAIIITSLPDNKPLVVRSLNPSFRTFDVLERTINTLSPTTEHAVEPVLGKSLTYGATDAVAIYILAAAPYGEVACSDIINLLFTNLRQLCKEKALSRESVPVPQLSLMISLMFEEGELVRKDFAVIKKMIKGKS